MNSEFEIRWMNMRDKRTRARVEEFLADNALRLDDVEHYYCVFRLEEEDILAGGGLNGNVIKCVAVREDLRDEHLFNMLVSHLMSEAFQAGHFSTKVYTKPQNLGIFRSLGFELIGQSPKALFMENSLSDLKQYKNYLKEHLAASASKRGLIVMNANPFTRGHRYLVEQAAEQVDQLYIIVVKENKSLFDYRYRLEMVQQGCADISNVQVLEGSDYQISANTFPTYFLKQVTDATDEHIQLDLDVCLRHIVPTLGISCRFVGSEPTDALTARYNELMHQILPAQGVKVVEIERLTQADCAISASRVRNCGDVSLLPPTSVPYVLGVMAAHAMRSELNLQGKPGLIGPDDNGSHSDMNYGLMLNSIKAIEPYLVKLAQVCFASELPSSQKIVSMGLEAEKAMLEATHGINTHKGAIFALGMMVSALAHELYVGDKLETEHLRETIVQIASGIGATNDTHGAAVREKHRVKGALDLAREGYEQLWQDWIPYYRQLQNQDDCQLRLLLHIVSTLDDNNLYHRGGAELTHEAQHRCAQVAEEFEPANLENLRLWMKSHNMSPGGAADMLALTLFAARIVYNI